MIMKLERFFGRYRLFVVIYLKALNIISKTDDSVRKLFGKKPILPRLEYHVSEQCNLNCKSCFHFSNLVSSNEFPDFNSFSKDLYRLRDMFDNIRVIRFLGGEPLLNPQLPLFIEEARKVFPKAKINLLTNGMLFERIDGQLSDTIKTCNAAVKVSLYKPLVNRKDEIKQFFKIAGIKFSISNPILYFGKHLNPAGSSKPKDSVKQCHASRCTFLKNGFLARCPMPFNIKHFNSHFGHSVSMGHELIDIHNVMADGYNIKAVLRQPMDSCRFCGKVEWVPWEQSDTGNGPAKIEDYVCA